MPMDVLPTGTVLENRYHILRLLGQGGMSRVYLAEDTRLGVRVAIKENLQTGHEAQTQFLREAQILARLSHPNLPKVTDHFIEATTGRQYLVMEYVEGEDLDSLIKRTGPLPEATALAWIRQILDALEYLHRQQPPIIHRDVKPGNIKITPEGKAVLVDFGIAKVYDPRQATLTGARAVTPGYAPPEQYGLRTTERSDIYGLGATLYTMLTGRVPPEAPLRMSGEETLVPPSRIVPGKVSPLTEQVILRAMDVETGKRWANTAQLRAALEGHRVVASPEPATVVVSKPAMPVLARKSNMVTLMVGVAIGVVLIGSLLIVVGSRAGLGSSKVGSTPMSMATPTLIATRVLTHTMTATLTSTLTPRPISTPTLIPSPTRASSPTLTPVLTSASTAIKCQLSAELPFVNLWNAYRTELGCPKEHAMTISTIAEEIFQGGHMFWRADTEEMYIVYDHRVGGEELFEDKWSQVPKEWRWDGSNPDGVGMSPPTGLYEPRRGFGWLWRTHLDGPNGPLGWALDREYGWDNLAKYQRFEYGLTFRASDPKVYGLLFNGRFVSQR